MINSLGYNCAFYISLVVLILDTGLIGMSLIMGRALSDRSVKFVWGSLTVAIACIAFSAEPSVSDDLYRHYWRIQNYRNSNQINFTPLIVWDILIQLVGNLKYDGYLPFIAVVVEGFCIFKIIENCKADNENWKVFPAYVLCYFGFNSVFAIISGIRNSLAGVLWAYAYFVYYKKNRKKEYYIIALIGCLIHVYSLIPVLILEGSQIINKCNSFVRKILIFITIFWSGLLNFVGSILKGISLPYVQVIVDKINDYFNADFYQNTWYILLPSKLCIIFLLTWHARNDIERDYYQFLCMYLLSALVSIFNYSILTDRMLVAVGAMSFPLLSKGYSKKNIILVGSLLVVCILSNLFYLNSLLAHISFNGISFYFGGSTR